MDTTVDLLQIKIEKAKSELSEESRRSIDAVDWKTVILGMRAEKGYSFEQLEALELETELLLCGLLNPADYPKELENRMRIPKPQVDVLVNEMNEKVFKKIREELVKNIERKKISESKEQPLETPPAPEEKPTESREELLRKIPARSVFSTADAGGETPTILNTEKPADMVSRLESEKELPEPAKGEATPSILEQKLSGSFQIPNVETEHTLNNISKDSGVSTKPKVGIPKVDPYREIPQ